MAVVTMKNLLESGVHFGHQTKRWDPHMKPYIFAERNGIHIIDLQKTITAIKIAYDAVRQTVLANKTVLFVGTKKQAQQAIEREAQHCGMFYVNNRWLGGMLTNFTTIRKSLFRLKKLEKMEVDGTYESLTKKEIARIDKEKSRMQRNLGGIKEMKEPPGIVFIIDTRKEAIAVAEARRMGIPIVAVVDTNCNPEGIDYPIPGNDDAIRAITLFTQIISKAVIEADNEIGLEVIESMQDDDTEQESNPAADATTAANSNVESAPASDVETAPVADVAAVATEKKGAEKPGKEADKKADNAEEEKEEGFTAEDYSNYQPDENKTAPDYSKGTRAHEVADEAGIDEDKLYEE